MDPLKYYFNRTIKRQKLDSHDFNNKEINIWMNENYIIPKTSFPKPIIIFNYEEDKINDLIKHIKENKDNIPKKSFKSLFNGKTYGVSIVNLSDQPNKVYENLEKIRLINQGKKIYIIEDINITFSLLEEFLLNKCDNNKKNTIKKIFEMIDKLFEKDKKFYNPIIFWIKKDNKYTYYLRKYIDFIRYDYHPFENDNIYKITEYFLLGTINGIRRIFNNSSFIEGNIPLYHIFNNIECNNTENYLNLMDSISNIDSTLIKSDSCSFMDWKEVKQDIINEYFFLLFNNARRKGNICNKHWNKLNFGNQNKVDLNNFNIDKNKINIINGSVWDDVNKKFITKPVITYKSWDLNMEEEYINRFKN